MPPVLPTDDHGDPLPPHDNPRPLSRTPHIRLKIPTHQYTSRYAAFNVRMTHHRRRHRLCSRHSLPLCVFLLTQALVQVVHHLAGQPHTPEVCIDRRIIIKHDALDTVPDVPLVPFRDLSRPSQRECLGVVHVVEQDDAPALVAPNKAPKSLQQPCLPSLYAHDLALQHDEPLGLGKLVRLEAIEQPDDRLFRGHHVAHDRVSDRRHSRNTYRMNASSAAARNVAPRVAFDRLKREDSEIGFASGSDQMVRARVG